jgi:hypothetical protein
LAISGMTMGLYVPSTNSPKLVAEPTSSKPWFWARRYSAAILRASRSDTVAGAIRTRVFFSVYLTSDELIAADLNGPPFAATLRSRVLKPPAGHRFIMLLHNDFQQTSAVYKRFDK